MGQLPPVVPESATIPPSDAASRLANEWTSVRAGTATVSQAVPQNIRDAIKRSVNSKGKTYRYVLPTQLIAKAVNPTLDCRSVQATSGLNGAFDARSVCDEVIVPFDRDNENVLGGSTEPYANVP